MSGIDTAAIRAAAVTEVTDIETVHALCDEVDQMRGENAELVTLRECAEADLDDSSQAVRNLNARVAELEVENERLTNVLTGAREEAEMSWAERDALRAAVNRVRAVVDHWATAPQPVAQTIIANFRRALDGTGASDAAPDSDTTCPHGDPTCPCPDGLWCHYEDDPVTGTKAASCKHCGAAPDSDTTEGER